MKLTENGRNFLAQEEGLRLNAYLDSAGVWTIGIGNTFYEDGTRVKKGDTITKDRALELFDLIVPRFEKAVMDSVKVPISCNMFDALVSLAYNIGVGGLKTSTLIKNINRNADPETIRRNFESWRYATVKGVKKPILLGRRKREADLYFLQYYG